MDLVDCFCFWEHIVVSRLDELIDKEINKLIAANKLVETEFREVYNMLMSVIQIQVREINSLKDQLSQAKTTIIVDVAQGEKT